MEESPLPQGGNVRQIYLGAKQNLWYGSNLRKKALP